MTTIPEALEANALGPKKATGDSSSIEQHSLTDQIEAAKFKAASDSVTSPQNAFVRLKIVPPGTI